MAIDTPKLHLLLIQEDWKFANDSFNMVLEDMDNKLLGIAHGNSTVHWEGWHSGYSYSKHDVIRISDSKSNQYYYCMVNGISGTTEPDNNVSGSLVTDGTVTWKVCEIGDSEGSASVDIFRGGLDYSKGQLVMYNNVLYRCKAAHVAAQTMELDTDKWQQVDASLQPWKTATYFLEDDIVVYNNVIYKCTTAHTSGYTFDYSKWLPLTITLIEDWNTSTDYLANQIVLYNGTLYRAVDDHTSDNSSFATDLAVPHWEYINANIPAWVANEGYLVGQVVLYNNRLYKCSTAHTATSTFDPTKWTPILASPVIEEWQASTNYLAGQLVLNSGMLLKALDNHTSDSSNIIADMDVANNNNHWTLVYANIAPWQASTVYEIGSQVIYNNNLYKAKDTHTSGNSFDVSHWELIGQFDAFLYNWQANKYYYANQVVVVDKELYRNTTSHTSGVDWDSDKSNWVKISAETLIEPWASSTDYLLNQVVTINGILYRCNTKHTSGSTFDTSKWTPLYANIVNWSGNTDYRIGELVLYQNQIYKCITAHNSGLDSFEDNGAKWQPIANNIAGLPAWSSGIYYYPNQVVKYDGKIWRCLTAHTSGAEEKPDYVKIYSRDTDYLNLTESSSVPKEFVADLGSVRRISNATIIYSGGFLWVSTKLLLSTDGVNYNEIESFSLSNSGTKYIDLYADARYVKVYVANVTPQTSGSGGLDFNKLYVYGDSNKWEIIYDPGIKLTYWSANIRYKSGELVLYDNEFYRCIETHESTSTFDATKWRKIPDIVIPNWKASEVYKVNQIVFFDGKLYRCYTAHTSTSTFDQTKWTPVNDIVDNWATSKYYYAGQLVWYNHSLWRCLSNHVSSTETPDGNNIYTSSSNIAQVNGTSTIPYSETIDLGSTYKITDISYNKNATEMTAKYTISTSTDNSTFTEFDKYKSTTSARYIKVTVDSVDIDTGATSPEAYLDNFIVLAESNKWHEVSTMNTLTSAEIDEMFI